jgi:hypothetical protein
MSALISYRGEVHNGVIRLQNGKLPEGAKVLVVAVEGQTASVEEQVRRLEAIPLAEWRKPFDEYVEFARQHPAEADIDTVSDDELNEIVHEVRAEMLAKK